MPRGSKPDRRVVTTVRRRLCFSEKSGTDAAKSRISGACGTAVVVQRHECTVGEHATVHSTALFTILIDLQPWPSTPFAFSSAAPRSPCVACPIHGLLGLLLRSSGAVGSSIEVTAAQDFERPRLSYHNQVSTLCSALVYRASQNVIRGPIFSSCLRQ